jgi:hypothetical protein
VLGSGVVGSGLSGSGVAGSAGAPAQANNTNEQRSDTTRMRFV